MMNEAAIERIAANNNALASDVRAIVVVELDRPPMKPHRYTIQYISEVERCSTAATPDS